MKKHKGKTSRKGGIKLPGRVGPLQGTAGVKEKKNLSRVQRVANMEKRDGAV